MHTLSQAIVLGCSPPCCAVLSGRSSCLFCRLINRELVAWMPDDNSLDPNLYALEDSGDGGWDQFAVNRKKFGYESGWNEDFYTVKLDKNK
jgi:PAB1-binding protein PBP1